MNWWKFILTPLDRVYRGAVYATLNVAHRLGASTAWAERTLTQLTGQTTTLSPAGRRWLTVDELSSQGLRLRNLSRNQIISLVGAPFGLNNLPAKYEVVLRITGMDGNAVEQVIHRSVFTDKDQLTFGELMDAVDKTIGVDGYDSFTPQSYSIDQTWQSASDTLAFEDIEPLLFRE